MLPAVASQLKIAIVGPGRLGGALALGLKNAGYKVDEIISRDRPASLREARRLARKVEARAATIKTARLQADLVWFLVPDRGIAPVARQLAALTEWKAKLAFHSSGALDSGQLQALGRRGAAVASVHPFMTFVNRSAPTLARVPFAIEGDPKAVRIARKIVSRLGGEPFAIPSNRKSAYHAWGAFTSPLLVSLLVTAEQVAAAAGFSRSQARRWALPIMQQTIANYIRLGPAGAFSGPIARGDSAVVRQHLQVLKASPAARQVYLALGRMALKKLPAQNRKQLLRAFDQ